MRASQACARDPCLSVPSDQQPHTLESGASAAAAASEPPARSLQPGTSGHPEVPPDAPAAAEAAEAAGGSPGAADVKQGGRKKKQKSSLDAPDPREKVRYRV